MIFYDGTKQSKVNGKYEGVEVAKYQPCRFITLVAI